MGHPLRHDGGVTQKRAVWGQLNWASTFRVIQKRLRAYSSIAYWLPTILNLSAYTVTRSKTEQHRVVAGGESCQVEMEHLVKLK